jgi:4-amino-4-deoxy-L-arabinose transferase-like glycosyltransferase
VLAQRLAALGTLLARQPLFWLLLVVGGIVIVAAYVLGSGREVVIGSPAERLYLRDGFYAAEAAPTGPFRWTHEYAQVVLPRLGAGPLTLDLTLLDGAPTSRAFWITLDGQEIYRGQTQPGGAPWTLRLPTQAIADSPLIGIAATPWTPPGDSRALGVGLAGLTVAAPQAGLRLATLAGALLLAVLVLAALAVAATGDPAPPLVAGLGVLGFLGPLLAYGDPWLRVGAPVALATALLVAFSATRAPRAGGSDRWAAGWGVVALAAGLLLFTLARFNTGDAEAMYQITAGLALDGHPWAHQDHAWVKFGLGKPLLDLPLYELGWLWAVGTGADAGQLTRFCVALLNQAITPAIALALFWGARRRYGRGPALALAGTFLLATPAITYARLAFAEPLSTLLILLAFLALWPLQPTPPADYRPTRRALLLAGLCLGLAVLVKPANAIYLPAPALYLAWLLARSHPTSRLVSVVRGGLWFGLGLAPGLALTAAYNMVRYASPFVFGYEQEGFTTPLLTGLYGLLLSPGKGILWFAPPVALALVAIARLLRGATPLWRAEALLIAVQAAIVLVFHALWSSWEGNIAWGPRLILPVVPLLLWPLGALAAQRWARAAWWALGALGFLVAIPGALIDQYYYFDLNRVYDAGTEAERLMLFDPAWSQIIAHGRFLLTGTRAAVERPVLADFGLPPGWDIVVPATLAALAMLAGAQAIRYTARSRPPRP